MISNEFGMVEIFRKIGGQLRKLDEFQPNSWINISNPTIEEIDLVVSKLNIPRDFITDPLDPDEPSRIDIEDNIKLIIIRIPLRNYANEDVPFRDCSGRYNSDP